MRNAECEAQDGDEKRRPALRNHESEIRNQKSSESGQAIAEFALAFPLLLLLVLGIIQMSLMFVAQTVVDYAAYAAARAEVVGEDPQRAAAFVCSSIAGQSPAPGVPQPITVPGWGVLPRSGAASLKTTVNVIDPGGDGNGMITVEVTHYYEMVVPFVSMIFKPISRPEQPGDVPTGPAGQILFATIGGAPHIILTSRYTRPVPWETEIQSAQGHPVIPDP